MAETAVVAAVFAGMFAMGSGIVAWLAQRSVTRLRSELSDREERLRSTLARELATHEPALRVRSEFRLKISSLSLDAIGQALAAAAEIFDSLNQIVVAIKAGGEVQMVPAERVAALSRAAFFLPPQLDQLFLDIMKGVAAFASEALKVKELPQAQRSARADALMTIIGTPIGKFREAANEWKRQLWSEDVSSHV